MMGLHERRRSAKQVREFLSGWASLVEREPHPNQMGMFGPVATTDKETLVNRWLSGGGQTNQQTLF